MIGAHNSMTFGRAKGRLMNLLSFCWRCQNKTIEEQFDAGARCFDVRIITRPGSCYCDYAHGRAILKQWEQGNVFNTLNFLAESCSEPIYVRLILEIDHPNEEIEQAFIGFVHWLRTRFCHLHFFEHRRKYDWEQLVANEGDHPEVIQMCGSMQSRYGKVWPRLWSYLNRKKILKVSAENPDKIVLVDFI